MSNVLGLLSVVLFTIVTTAKSQENVNIRDDPNLNVQRTTIEYFEPKIEKEGIKEEVIEVSDTKEDTLVAPKDMDVKAIEYFEPKLENEGIKEEVMEISDTEEDTLVAPKDMDVKANNEVLDAIQNGEVDLRPENPPNIKFQYGWTPLEIACVSGNFGLVETFLGKGAVFGVKEDYVIDVLMKKQMFDVLDLLNNHNNNGAKD